MADTQRTRAQLLTLFADNATGQISAQDLRDFAVTIMELEFANAGDFWRMPAPIHTTTDKYARGWIDHSQTVGSAVSFMNVLYLNASGVWMRADVSTSTMNGVLGMAMNSYNSGDSTTDILRKGVVYHSAYSATWSGYIGRPIYLCSGSPGSISITKTTNSALVIGWMANASDMSTVTASGKFYFEPEWAIRGS